jgi:HEAT repeat protein
MRVSLFWLIPWLLASATASPPARELPRFRGKTLGQWARGLDDSDPRVRCRSAAALGLSRFGKAAVPALLRSLQDRDLRVRLRSIESLRLIGPDAAEAIPVLAKLLKEDNKELTGPTLATLAHLGPAAVPVLVRQLGSGESESVACLLLGMGEPAMPALMGVLHGKELSPRKAVLLAAWKFSERAAPLVPALERATDDPDRTIRVAAINTLSAIRPVAPSTVAKLGKLLEREEDGSWAAEALGRIGAAGLPPLRKAFFSGIPELRQRALEGLKFIGPAAFPLLAEGLKNPCASCRAEAVHGLGPCHPAVKGILPLLLRASKDKDADVRRTALLVLGTLDDSPSAAVVALAEALADPNAQIRAWAEMLFRHACRPTTAPVPILVGFLTRKDKELRCTAVKLLGQIGSPDREVVLGLCAALRDTDEDVRLKAVQSLGWLGSAARRITIPAGGAGELGQAETEAVVPALLRALRDRCVWVRIHAALALQEVGYPANEAVPILIDILADRAGQLASLGGVEARKRAARALGGLGPVAVPAIATLVRALREPDLFGEAALALASIGPAAEGAIPILGDHVLRQTDRFAYHSGLWALAKMGPPAVPFLKKAMSSKDVDKRQCAVGWVAHVAERSPSLGRALLPALIRATGDPDSEVRANAIVSLGHLGAPAAAAVPALIVALGDEDKGVRSNACEALRAIGPAARPAIPALVNLLVDHDPEVRRQIIMALKAIGPDVTVALPALAETLADRDSSVALLAADALGAMGSSARAALPALSSLLDGQDGELRVAGALGVWRIRRHKEEVVPVLRAALRDRNSDVRVAAAVALWEVEWSRDAVRLLRSLVGRSKKEPGVRQSAR